MRTSNLIGTQEQKTATFVRSPQASQVLASR